MPKIQNIYAYEILDTQGFPALEVTILLEDGIERYASSASQVTPSPYGSEDLLDRNEKYFQGRGLTEAIKTVDEIIKPKFIGVEVTDQRYIDRMLLDLDGTVKKSKLGANTMITVSIAAARAAADSLKMPLFRYLREIRNTQNAPIRLPTPVFTMIEGGEHVNFATDMEDFLVVPASFKTFQESLEIGSLIHIALQKILLRENMTILQGEKGGFAPNLGSVEDALTLLLQASESISLRLGYDLYLGIACNANGYYKDKKYKLKERSMSMSNSDMTNFLDDLSKRFHILYIEDPLSDEDVEGWTHVFKTLNQTSIIVGNSFVGSNPLRLHETLEKKTIGGIVVNPSWLGTVTESLALAEMAHTAGLKTVVVGTLAETNDTFLSDFSVAIDADYVRFGAPVRGERIGKYNRLLEIERKKK